MMPTENNMYIDYSSRILVVGGPEDHLIAKEVTEKLRLVVTRCASVAAATALVEELRPHVVLVTVGIRGAHDFVRWVKRRTGSSVILVSPEPFFREMADWNADGHVQEPLDENSLSIALKGLCPDAVADPVGIDDALFDISAGDRGIDDVGSEIDEVGAQNVHVVAQEVIAIWGTKGGAGRTCIAANLAAHLKDFKVLLVDLNFNEGPGDLGIYLGLPPVPHIGKMLDDPADRRQGFLDSICMTNNVPFAVIQPPPTWEQAERITPDEIVDLIDQARRMFQIVILDLPADQAMTTLEAIDMATSVIFVTPPHKGSIARIEAVKAQRRLGVNQMLVVNRSTKSSIKDRELSHGADLPLAAVIGEDAHLEACAKKGKIIVDSGSNFSKGIVDIAQSLLGLRKTKRSAKRGLARLFKAN